MAGADEEVKKLAELVKAPVATTLMGKGIVDEKDDISIGMLGMHGKQVANQNVNKTDCLLAIGCRFSDRTTGKLEEFLPEAKVIHIDIDPAEIGKNVAVDLPIVGDAKIVLNQLIKELEAKPSDKNAWLKSIVEFKKSTIPRVR